MSTPHANNIFWRRLCACPVTITLALATLLSSLGVACFSQGALLATVPVKDLRHLGGLDFEQLRQGKIWLLATSQLVHVKQAHMFLNVATLLYAGLTLERLLGHVQVLLLWLLAGSAGILVSVYYAVPPYEVGSGASQATTAMLAASILIIVRKQPYDRFFPLITTLIGLSIFGLDLLFSGMPKPGHVAAFVAGYALTLVFFSVRAAANPPAGLALRERSGSDPAA